MKKLVNLRVIGAILFLFFLNHGLADGQTNPLLPTEAPPVISARSAVVMDAETGTILFSHNPAQVIAPASLTKLMTSYLCLRAIQTRKVSADDVVKLPPETWAENQPPRSSLMFLGRNQTVTLGELLLGMAVSSGNDAAVASALHIAPGLEAFIAMMNAEAGRLLLASTRFVEPAGVSPENTTSAIDLARFCRVYVNEHPDSLALLHSRPSLAYPLVANTGNELPRTILQYNRNTLLSRFSGMDGLKTGYIPESGYNIALTAIREENRFIVILLGSPNEDSRDRDGLALLEWVFSNYKTLRPNAIPIPALRIWGGKERYADLIPAEDLVFTVSSSRAGVLQMDTELFSYLKAPLAAGEQGGVLKISDGMGELRRIPLLLENEAVRGNFFQVLIENIKMFIQKKFGKSFE
ncbi:MAG: D-alanyl-D-alanine carboxypeptidase [Treponema sp.]|jgi:D-alanyl-D-alanine carboxypeptidase (penicillin-binding protein 5/6)|nr:D-alanyl-D-alanine carboxypeptidase [Treponema sp.]